MSETSFAEFLLPKDSRPTLSVRDLNAQRILKDDHKRRGPLLSAAPLLSSASYSGKRKLHVGILGSGAAGLYAAMILKYLSSQPGGEDITYEILEANPNRIGGRLYTHYFSESPNDYYDVGAMRFPEIPIMDRTFDLFRIRLDLGHLLIPYTLVAPESILFFNNIRMSAGQYDAAMNANTFDPFHTGVQGLVASAERLIQTATGVLEDPFRIAGTTWEQASEILMEADGYTVRSYMTSAPTSYSENLVTYLETFDTATGHYDSALSEAVMHSLEFNWEPGTNWFCVQGGMKVVVDAMVAQLRDGAIEPGKRATAIARSQTRDANGRPTSLEVTVAGEPSPRTYDHVISTLPFSCLRILDTSSLGLSWQQQTAVRTLQYDPSVKVAIKFRTRWWEEHTAAAPVGRSGVTKTDRPTRVVVYPSYGVGGPEAVIIVSYTWGQDAARLGGLVGTPAKEDLLLDIILHDLADIHDITNAHGERDYGILRDLKVAHHAFNWYDDEYAIGAFAFFGPGQFKNIYPEVTKPAAGGLFHFAGEATSAHHGWVVGALNSAWRSVYEILRVEGRDDLIQLMIQNWGTVNEYDLDQLNTQIDLGL